MTKTRPNNDSLIDQLFYIKKSLIGLFGKLEGRSTTFMNTFYRYNHDNKYE